MLSWTEENPDHEHIQRILFQYKVIDLGIKQVRSILTDCDLYLFVYVCEGNILLRWRQFKTVLIRTVFDHISWPTKVISCISIGHLIMICRTACYVMFLLL